MCNYQVPGSQLRSLGLQQSRSSRDVIFIQAPRHPALAAGAAAELPRHDFEFCNIYSPSYVFH